MIETARTEFHSLVAKLDVSKLVNKNLYVALCSNFYVLTDRKDRKRNLVAVEQGEMISMPGILPYLAQTALLPPNRV